MSAGDAAQPQEDPASRSSFNRLAGLEGTYAVAVTGSGFPAALGRDRAATRPAAFAGCQAITRGAGVLGAVQLVARDAAQRTVALTDEGALDLCQRSALHAPIISVGGYAE